MAESPKTKNFMVTHIAPKAKKLYGYHIKKKGYVVHSAYLYHIRKDGKISISNREKISRGRYLEESRHFTRTEEGLFNSIKEEPNFREKLIELTA